LGPEISRKAAGLAAFDLLVSLHSPLSGHHSQGGTRLEPLHAKTMKPQTQHEEETTMRNRFSMTITLLAAFFAGTATAQTNYDDVLIVVNQNSSMSESIGTYFAAQRNIPAVNIARISVPTTEEIDSTQFNDLRSQLEAYITSHNLENQINYIVTTKGIPLKVNRGNTFSTSSPSSSVESELTLILGPYREYIGRNGSFLSPYYFQNVPFSRAAYGIFLVTRLDGYTYNDIKTLIDKAAQPNVITSDMRFVFDQDPDWNGSLPGLNNSLMYANQLMIDKGLMSTLENTTVYKTGEVNVIGYASWGSNDHYANQYTQYARPRNFWAAGAIAETYVSTSGRTFNDPATYGQSLIADIIAEGVTGAKGYVYEPYSSSMAVVWLLFDRYVSGYNLAESFYSASRSLSWMDVIIGDPKATVIPGGSLPITLASFDVQMSGTAAELSWMTISEINNLGFEIQRRIEGETEFASLPGVFIPGNGTTIEPQFYSYTDSTVPTGTVYYRLRQIDLDGTSHYSEAVSIQNTPVMSAGDERLGAQELRLEQNFPNPFNPSTEIRFSLPNNGRTSLKIYNSIGQEVATLIDGELSRGSHSIPFNGANLASGVYFYRLQTDETSAMQKMILSK
jgi:uncharacterized protein (TIGR03790 family)